MYFVSLRNEFDDGATHPEFLIVRVGPMMRIEAMRPMIAASCSGNTASAATQQSQGGQHPKPQRTRFGDSKLHIVSVHADRDCVQGGGGTIQLVQIDVAA